MNRVLLVGRVVKDPELKRIEELDKVVCNFTLAVDRYNFNKSKKEADFIPISVWGRKAEVLSEFGKKGRLIGVTGKLQVKSYENTEGIRKYITQVIADEIQFLDYAKVNSEE